MFLVFLIFVIIAFHSFRWPYVKLLGHPETRGQPEKAQVTFAKTCFVEHYLAVALERSYWSLLMSNFKSNTAWAAAIELFDRVRAAKIPQTTSLCLFQRPFSPFHVEFLLSQTIFLGLSSSFTRKPIAKILTRDRNQEIFTRLKLKSYRS